MTDQVYLTLRDLAERLRVSEHTVYRWNSSRTGPPYIRAGRHCRYRLDDVIKWEQDRYRGTGA